MFRLIFSQVHKPLTSGFCTKAPIVPRIRREVNDVKIVGTLISEPYTLKSGTRALTIRTKDSPTKHSNHNVHVRFNADFVTGQRVFISGILRSTPMHTSDGKLITASVIKAKQVYILDNEGRSASLTDGDQNQVELLANVASDVLIKDEFCTFAVATHFTKKISDGETETETETDGTSFHRVFVYEPNLREYIQNLKKSDRVLLNGRIGHMTYTGADGKRSYSGFIIPESLNRVARRSTSQSETNESTEYTAEN